jgi:hypothetical protein
VGGVVHRRGLGHALSSQPLVLHQIGSAHAPFSQGTDDAIPIIQNRAF